MIPLARTPRPLARPTRFLARTRRPGRTARLAGLLTLAAVVAACGQAAAPGGTVGDTPGSSPASSAETACESGVFPGWPQPGQVTTSGIIPVLASSEKTAGQGRLLFVLVDDQNRPIANESLEVEIAFFDLCADPATATESVTPTFTWGIVGSRAFYVATPELTQPGPWGAAVTVRDPATGKSTSAKLQFTVSESGFGPRVGDPAPPVRTLTLADVGGDVRKISTDPNPEPAFYGTSLEAALAANEPFVLAFLTPGFCKSAQCGPTMEILKAAVRDAPIRVVAVEPYKLAYQDGRLQPVLQDGDFVPVEATDAYGIPTEPWLFVVDANGTIASSFEAVVGRQELADAIRAVTEPGGGPPATPAESPAATPGTP